MSTRFRNGAGGLGFRWRSGLAVAGVAAFSASLLGCGSASDAEATAKGSTALIEWEGTAARICVTEPSVECPQGKDDKIEAGKVYWVLDASCWPGGIDGPVEYGVLPNCAKDKTEDNKGKWEPLQKGVTYKITVTGFGGDATITELAWGG